MKQLPHKIFVLFSTNVIPITHSNNWGQFLATPKWGDLSADPEKISYKSKESKGLAKTYMGVALEVLDMAVGGRHSRISDWLMGNPSSWTMLFTRPVTSDSLRPHGLQHYARC